MIIPSIDLMNGKAVQLRQGKKKVLEKENVLELAKEFSKYGELAVIDLDAALGKGNNLELISKICKIADCRVGGGIRTTEMANELLGKGARKIIIGTRALPEFLEKLPKKRVIVAIDTKDSYVVDEGWTRKTVRTLKEAVAELENYCSEFLFTNVDKEGLMQGCDLGIVKELKKITKNKLTVAGGITTLEEIKELEDLGANSQLGMALYTGKIKLDEAFISLLDFRKNNGLIPTIVQDERKQVLMLAFSSKDSLLKTFRTRRATYYSRSRKNLWTKGETSGNFQEIITARYDCDRDTLLFTVRQKNAACHLGNYSCFGDGEREFCLEELYDVIQNRIKDHENSQRSPSNFQAFSSDIPYTMMKDPGENSYTSKISKDEELIKEKIREESEEVLNYKDRNNLVWELADLTYFLLVLMAKKGITTDDVKSELWRRRK